MIIPLHMNLKALNHWDMDFDAVSGLLHMEIISERVQREYNLEFLMTVPSVTYRIENKERSKYDIRKPSDLPDDNTLKCYYEPIASYVYCNTINNILGSVIELCTSKRGIQIDLIYRTNMVEITL